MDPILDLAEAYDLIVVEDACQAHGAYYGDRRAGSMGHTGTFSFYPTKNLGGCGDAGIVVTDDREVAEEIQAMRNCGQKAKYYHELPPFNHRMDTLQAAILRVKLHHLDNWIAARRRVAALYTDLLEQSDVITPVEIPGSTHVYHLYVIRVPNRDALRTYLWEECGVGTGIHYPVPIHLQPFYADHGYREGQFPVTEQVCGEILSLPIFPEMSDDQVAYVAEQVKVFFRQPDRMREVVRV
jgi:dTDP-4-amino-4,6-dideoxygalactose transaminase